MSKQITVIKYDSTKEPLSERKLRNSIRNAGIEKVLENDAVRYVTERVYNEITTKGIHDLVVEYLNVHSAHIVPSYNLKKAIMHLGPSGYSFEKYIGRILECIGYSVEVGKIVNGQCVTHEVDVIAIKNNQHFMIECKYHNRQGYKTDVKVPMYIKSRFEDVEAMWVKKKGHEHKFHQAWVVTNTKFTTDAIAFGKCIGIKLIGWGYPNKGSLQELIENTGLHPVTCLMSLSEKEKHYLLDNGIVLCMDLREEYYEGKISDSFIAKDKIDLAISEMSHICK